jgi:hypothetical protein
MAMAKYLIPAVAVLAVLTGCSSSTSHPAAAHTAAASPAAPSPAAPSPAAPSPSHHRLTSRQAARQGHGACDPSLWRAIYHPGRLHVVDSCKTVTGTVESVRYEPDGDVHLGVKLPARLSSLLNSGNYADQHGDLVVEIICVGTVSQADAESACSGHTNQVTVPSDGERVRITGTYVLDADHGWMEIHPVTRLTVTGYVAPAPAPAPAPSSAAPPAPAGCHPTTSSGNCYEPGEFCPEADAGMTGIAGDGERITCVLESGRYHWHPVS